MELPCLYSNPWTISSPSIVHSDHNLEYEMERPFRSTRVFEHARSWSPTTHQVRPEQDFYQRRRREINCHCLGQDKQRYRCGIEHEDRGHGTLQEHIPICSKGRDEGPERGLGEDEAELLLDKYLENFTTNE